MRCCVLDTSAILQRFQPTPPNAEYLLDTLYENQKLELYLPLVCISEAIQQFYRAYSKSQATFTPMTIGERTDLVNRLRQDIKDNKLIPYPATESLFTRAEEIFNASSTVPAKRSEPIDAADTLVIASALELRSVTEMVDEVYILSSDYHLLAVANGLGIQCFDPKLITVDQLPPCFSRREYPRRAVGLKVTYKDCEAPDLYEPTWTVDMSEYGVCIAMSAREVKVGDRINLIISPYNDDPENVTERNGTVKWSKGGKLGIELEEPIELDSLLTLTLNKI